MKLRFVSTLLLLLLMAFMLPTFASAAPQESTAGVPLFFNGKELKPEVAPRIIKDVTMVPVRIIAEELGSKVEWNQAARKVTITKNSVKIEMVINQLQVNVNGVNSTLDSAPVLIAGNTLLPVRFIAENMGIDVSWNDVGRAVYLYEKPAAAVKPDTAAPNPVTAAPLPVPTDKPVVNNPADKPSDKLVVSNPSDKPSVTNPVTVANGKQLPIIKTIEATPTQLIIKSDAGEMIPLVFPLHGPERTVIDIPNAVLDPALYTDPVTKSGSTASKNEAVSNIRYSLYNNNPNTVRIVLDMKGNSELKWESGWSTASLVGVFQKGAKYKVVIDPGHGDQDPGAKAVNGSTEKEFNLTMGLKVFALLQNETQIQPFLTRNDDTFIPLDGRANYANNLNADAFVSIHGNSYLSSSTGTETYYYKADSVGFAQIMHNHLAAATGLPDRGVRQQPFRVVKITNMPAVLLEVGYLSNARDTALMYNDAFQNKVAAAIVAGIKEQLNIQ